jgi:malate/lactate dehydrogenase
MAKTREILNNEKHIFREKVLLEQSANPNDLCISIPATAWEILNWKEGMMLEVRQDDIDKDELTIRIAPKSIREQVGISFE